MVNTQRELVARKEACGINTCGQSETLSTTQKEVFIFSSVQSTNAELNIGETLSYPIKKKVLMVGTSVKPSI